MSDEEKAAIDSFGFFSLNDFLPKKPTDVEVKVMTEMFEASVDGEAYDPDRFGQYFRAPGMSASTGDPNKGASAPAAAPVAEATPAPVAELAPAVAEATAPASSDKPSSERAKIFWQ